MNISSDLDDFYENAFSDDWNQKIFEYLLINYTKIKTEKLNISIIPKKKLYINEYLGDKVKQNYNFYNKNNTNL